MTRLCAAPASPTPPARRTGSLVAAVSAVLVIGTPVAWAEWPQFQGDAAHDGITDGPVAPFAVADAA